MGVVRQQGIQNTILAFFGTVVGAVNTILLFPNIFEAEVVGLTTVMVSASMIYSQLSALGAVNATIRFFPFFKTEDNRHGGFPQFVTLMAIIGFLLATLLFVILKPGVVGFYEDSSPLFVNYYYHTIVLAFFTLMFNVLAGYLRAHMRSVAPAFAKDLMLRLMITGSIAMFAFGWVNIHEFIVLFIVAHLLSAVILVIAIAKYSIVPVSKNLKLPSAKQLWDIVKYGLFSVVSGITDAIVKIVDTLMLAALAGLAEVGIYSRGYFLATLLVVPARSLYKIALPVVAKQWKENNLDEMAKLYKKVSLNNTIIGILIFINVWVNIEGIFSMMPAKYEEGIMVFLMIALARFFDLATGINYGILLTSKYYRYETLFNLLLAGLTILLNALLIPPYGIMGAAVATTCAIFFINLLRVIYVWAKFKMQPFTSQLLFATMIGAGILFLGKLIPDFGADSHLFLVLNILAKSAVVSVLFVCAVYYLKLSTDLKEVMDKVLKRIF